MGPGDVGHHAQRLRVRFQREIEALLDTVDVLVFPGQAGPAQRFEDISSLEVMAPGGRYTSPWNLLGLPAVSVPGLKRLRKKDRKRVPAGFTRAGLPVSIQLVGRMGDDATVLRVARAYERATDWQTRRPDPAGWRLA